LSYEGKSVYGDTITQQGKTVKLPYKMLGFSSMLGRLISCMPLLSLVERNEALSFKALIMGEVNNPTLRYRTLGSRSFQTIPLTHEARGVYRATIPGQQEDFEWYITANTSLGDVVFPATAGAAEEERMYQTVVVTR